MCVLSQNLPVATLYGDVQIRFADWVRHLTHYDPSKWTCTSESAEEKVTVSLQSRVETIRSEHVRFISDLARYNNEVSLCLFVCLSVCVSVCLCVWVFKFGCYVKSFTSLGAGSGGLIERETSC